MIAPRDGIERPDQLHPDPDVSEALARLDPAQRDPNYWLRFRSWVMEGAAGELARRRLMAKLTVGDVVESWARALVPAAALAAAVAALLLVRGDDLAVRQPVGVEEALVREVDGETLPMMLEAEEGTVAFATEIF